MNRILQICLTGLWAVLMAQSCTSGPTGANQGQGRSAYRFATFNLAMGLPQAGAMAEALESGEDARLKALAAVLQTVRPDVVLLNEFDYDPTVEAADLLNRLYLEHARDGLEPISYPYHFRPPVNTGVASGLDIDVDGALGEPEDAWGFGHFPGQYGMLVLSRFPIVEADVRSFQMLPWSVLPGALEPRNEDGSLYYPADTWTRLRLSSKNHVDVPIRLGEHTVHLLATHPTPPGFDGPEDRNGKRNHDELSIWAHYISREDAPWLVDDDGNPGPIEEGAAFVIAGDLNADPSDGGSRPGAIAQLLEHPAVDSSCVPTAPGGARATRTQAGVNLSQRGDPAADTADFNDERTGNLRVDYVLPSRNLTVLDCGLLWPEAGSEFHDTATFSDHRLVWVDIKP